MAQGDDYVESAPPAPIEAPDAAAPIEQPEATAPIEPGLDERTELPAQHDSNEETAQAGQDNSGHDQRASVDHTSPAESDHSAPPRRKIDWKSIKRTLKEENTGETNTGDPGSGSTPTAPTSDGGKHGVSTTEDGMESEESYGHGEDGKESTTPRKREPPKKKQRGRKEQGGPSGRKSKAELITFLKNCQRQKHGGITTLSTKALQQYPAEFTKECYIRTDSAIMGLNRSELGLTQAEFFTSDGHLRERSLADNAQARDSANGKFGRTNAGKDTEEAANSTKDTTASTIPTGAQNVVVEAIWKTIGNGQKITAEKLGLQRMGKNIRSLVEFAQEKAKKDILHERFMTKAFEKIMSQSKPWRKYARQWKTAYGTAERHVELQANAIEELKDLIPEDQLEKLQEQDIPEWKLVQLQEPELPLIGQPLTEEDLTTDDKAAIKPSTSKVSFWPK
ncbi:uncharacterized protein LTHEOB_7187 [Lasiodiplodia theobromae]|uniref:uncharacterized protein n=1 Tax=Lasiodiplodia theobromae TaxID=45133 RepID=UPI0015C35CB6|nr:uncharacterized protein LTHEOB_7187 [Lasiodiplodia theobromae]KAF4542933.1 hypothetical protein LTHEOB_7187 [Lasiodiplodia theobromae]